MRTKSWLILASALGFIGSAIVIIILRLLLTDHSAELARSIDVVLYERLQLKEVRITKTVLSGRRETDASGYWSVDVQGSMEQIVPILVREGFGESDQADTEYFKSMVRDEFNAGGMVGHRAFEASLVLGKGTICEQLPCNVVALLAPEQSQLYIAIWRI